MKTGNISRMVGVPKADEIKVFRMLVGTNLFNTVPTKLQTLVEQWDK